MEKIVKDKSKLNLILDIVMLLLMMGIAGIGLLMKYVLVAGYERNAKYGNNVDLELLGLTRHEWGTIHLIISITFLVLLILHIFLHWNMIVCIFKRIVPRKAVRITLTSVFTVIIIFLIAFPLFVEPEIVDRVPLHKNNKHNSESSVYNDANDLSTSTDNTAIDQSSKSNNESNVTTTIENYEVYGSQTLQFVADKYNVPASTIAADLGIPVTMVSEKLGRLKKQYSFTMDDVKNSISNYKKRAK